MAKTSSVKTNTDEDFTEKEDAKEETSEMRYERLKRREEDYYYKHFAEQVYSRGLLEEHFALYDLALTEPDEVQGCCPACCHNVRRTCFIFGFVTTVSRPRRTISITSAVYQLCAILMQVNRFSNSSFAGCPLSSTWLSHTQLVRHCMTVLLGRTIRLREECLYACSLQASSSICFSVCCLSLGPNV